MMPVVAEPKIPKPKKIPTGVNRTIKVPLEFLPHDEWFTLLKIGYKCATYGNKLLNESYISAKGGEKFPTYTDAAGELSSSVRDAIGRECVGIWRRLGKKILKGEERSALFTVKRAIVCREKGVKLERSGDNTFFLRLRLLPKSVGDLTTLPVWGIAMKRDKYLVGTLNRIAAGVYRLTKATIKFERPGRKVFALLSYEKPFTEHDDWTREASVLRDELGLLYLHCDGQMLALGDWTHRLETMKSNFSKIHERLARCLGKRGRWRDRRKALQKAGTFEAWSVGPIHQMTAEMVKWFLHRKVGRIEWRVVSDLSLPFDEIFQKLKYKAEERGITVEKINVKSTQGEDAESGATDPVQTTDE